VLTPPPAVFTSGSKQTQQVITFSVIVSRHLTDFSSFIPLLNLRSIISCWEISILLRLSNSKLEKLDVTYRLSVLINKAAGENTRRRLIALKLLTFNLWSFLKKVL